MKSLKLSTKSKKSGLLAFRLMLGSYGIIEAFRKLNNKDRAIIKQLEEIVEYLENKDANIVILETMMCKLELIQMQPIKPFKKGGIILKSNTKKK